ncbi:MAG: PPC domain-containing DNA-binding protein, partial [Promethearchaeota archaeon]
TVGRVIVAKLEPEDDVLDSIKELVEKYEIKAGLVNCIGGFKKFTIGFFDLDIKQYKFKTFKENVELISCMGNISYKDGEPIIHIHVAIGRDDYTIKGGHLSQPSIISVTGEVYIYEISQKLKRANDPQFDLSLLVL